MNKVIGGCVMFLILIGFTFAVDPQEQGQFLRECGLDITANTTPLRKEIAGLKSSYIQLRDKEVSENPVYQVLASERDQIENLMASGGGSDSLQTVLSSVNGQLIAVRDSIPASDSLLAIDSLIAVRKAAMDTLAAQVKENSSVCQQAYAEE